MDQNRKFEPRIVLLNTMTELDRLPGFVDSACVQYGTVAEQSVYLSVILDELLTNTISYGYPDGRAGRIDVKIGVRDGTFELEVRDDADAFDVTAVETPDLSGTLEERDIGGLGIHLVRSLSRSFCWERQDNMNIVQVWIKALVEA